MFCYCISLKVFWGVLLTHSLIGLGGLDVVPVYTGDFLISFVLKIKKNIQKFLQKLYSQKCWPFIFCGLFWGLDMGEFCMQQLAVDLFFYWQITELLKLNDAYNSKITGL